LKLANQLLSKLPGFNWLVSYHAAVMENGKFNG